MSCRHPKLGVVVLPVLCCVGAISGRAIAVDPFEIQVYEGDINDPGQAGLELHTNYTASGRKMALYPGEVPPNRLLRATLEPSLGMLRWWELGLYLQFAVGTESQDGHFGGFKLRSKLIVPRSAMGTRLTDFTVGLNIEVGRGVQVFGGTDWDTELRPILAWGKGRWFVAVNPIVGWALTGDRHAVPDFEPAGKARFDTHLGFGVGVEYYAGLGLLSSVPAFKQQEHVVYAAADLIDGPIELNVAVGHGLSDASDDWVIKTILGREF